MTAMQNLTLYLVACILYLVGTTYYLVISFPQVREGPHVLMSIVTGEALDFRNNTSDLNVLKSCLQLLRNMFDVSPW